MNYTIGVAIATFNGQDYLEQQLESIISQTTLPDFISISDDASTDETAQILENFKRTSKVAVALNRNKSRVGVIDNFMTAFSGCKTDYIAYCDQDDVWMPEKISVYREALKSQRISLAFHRSTIVDEKLNPIGRFEPFNIRGGIYHFPHFPDYLWGYGHQMIFSQQVLTALREIQDAHSKAISAAGHSFDFGLLLAAGMVGNIYFIDRELMCFRRHQKSVSVAGKQDSTRSKWGTIGMQDSRLQQTTGLLTTLVAEMARDAFQPTDDASSLETYLAHLKVLEGRYLKRVLLNAPKSRLERMKSFQSLVKAGTYGSPFQNKLPARPCIRDLLSCFV